MALQPPPKNQIQSVGRVIEIIETLQDLQQAGVSEISDEVDMATSTVHDYLSTLEYHGYVTKEDARYKLSLRFLEHGISARRGLTIDAVTQKMLQDLADETGEIVWLISEQNGFAVHLQKAVGEHGVQTHGRIGLHSHMHYLAAGKAILSQYSRQRVDDIIDKRGLPQRTSNTIDTREALYAELDEIRSRGYAFNDKELYEGVRCIGAPIVVRSDEVLGAISICGPANRLIGERYRSELPTKLLGFINEIELRLSYSP